MHAIVATAPGGPEVLSPVDAPDPTPGPGQVVVEVAAAGVNFIDSYRRSGPYPVPYPQAVSGTEGAGRVVALGDGDEQAAALLLQDVTARHLSTSTVELRLGEEVLLHAAAGGVGLLITQLATARGAHVLPTVGSVYQARPSIGACTRTRAALTGRTDELFADVPAGRLTVRTGARCRLDEAADAHRALEGRTTAGKVLLLP